MDTASLIFYLLATLLVIASLLVVFLRNVVHCAMALVAALLLDRGFVRHFAGADGRCVASHDLRRRDHGLVSFRHHVSQPCRAGTAARPMVGLRHNARRCCWPACWCLCCDQRFASRSGGGHGAYSAVPEMLAKSLFSDFVLPFEIASVLLLVAIIGAVVLAKREH